MKVLAISIFLCLGMGCSSNSSPAPDAAGTQLKKDALSSVSFLDAKNTQVLDGPSMAVSDVAKTDSLAADSSAASPDGGVVKVDGSVALLDGGVPDLGNVDAPFSLDAQGTIDVKVIPDATSRHDGQNGSTTVDVGGSLDLTPSSTPPKPAFGDGPIGFASLNGGTTGGKGGNVIRPKNGAELAQLLTGVTPLIIELEGTFVLDGSMTDMGSNKTVIGVGAGAKITGAGLYLYAEKNVIIRNIEFADMVEDGIGITESTTNVWIDHCTFSNGADGLVDVVRKSNYVTLSWNIFKNHVKTILIGHSDSNTSDTGNLKTTLHHNWFQKTGSRHPSVRFAQVHVFNNFYDTNSTYGVASRMEADVVVENNFFLNTYFPCHAGYAESAPGDVVAINNIIRVTQPPVPSSDKNDPVPPEIPVCETRGAAFDPKSYYPYTPDLPDTIPALVMLYSGANKL